MKIILWSVVFLDTNCLFFILFVYQDTMLTKEEILNNHKYFVGSKATNYGKDLTRHEEF